MSAATSPDDPADDLRPHYDLRQLRWREGRGRDFARYAAAAEANAIDLREATGEEPTSGLVLPKRNTTYPEFRERVDREWKPWAAGCCPPIWAARDSLSGIAGSGTLFRMADTSFLVTAEHVVADAAKSGSQLFLTDPGNPARRIGLNGRPHWSVERDVYVWELTTEEVDALPNWSFLSVHQADRRNRRPFDGLYVLIGYPAVQVDVMEITDSRTAVAKGLPYLTLPYHGAVAEETRYDPADHILLVYTATGNKRADGTIPTLPPLQGISGCSLWQVYAAGTRADLWSPQSSAVVAVQTHVNRDLGYIRGTRWWVVDRLIREGWPHLAPALSLDVPDPAGTV